MELFLADFVLGLPEDASLGAKHLAPETPKIWSAYQPNDNPSDNACAAVCRHSLQCFTHYVGSHGCFLAFGDHTRLEASPDPPLLLANGRKLAGKLVGCSNKTGDECSMRAELNQSLGFVGVHPDWRVKRAAIEFALEVEAGEQRHEEEATTIQLQQGPPVPMDAIGILLGASNNSTTVLNSTTTVDRLGNVNLEVAEYDPLSIDSLRLLLLVMLPDRDFNASWASFSAANQDDLLHLKQHPKCTESALNRARYAACGAPAHGQVEDLPIEAALGVWSGRSTEPLDFQVVPREAAPWWTPAQQSVAITFAGADSPVAWAAKREGCRVLKLAASEVAASADAACHLLSENCTQEVCTLLDEEAFGGNGGLFGHRPPKLHSKSLAQALGCHQVCNRRYEWELSNGILSMEDHSAKLAVTDLLVEGVKSDDLALLTAVRDGLPEEETRSEFLKELAKDTWTLPLQPSFIFAMANLSAEMPQELLKAWVTSASVAPQNTTELSQLQAAFASVEEVEFHLTEPEQLERVATLPAPNLEGLWASCAQCPASPAPWPRWPRAAHVRVLGMSDFDWPTLPDNAFRNFTELKELYLNKNRVQNISEKAFHGLGALTALDLSNNRLQNISEKAFDGLGALKVLDLRGNDPGLQRPSVCEEKNDIACGGPWDES